MVNCPIQYIVLTIDCIKNWGIKTKTKLIGLQEIWETVDRKNLPKMVMTEKKKKKGISSYYKTMQKIVFISS